jgi:hypothetical protein
MNGMQSHEWRGPHLLHERIADLERQLANEEARDIHSCHADCPRNGCVNRRLRERIEALEKQNAELLAALARLLRVVPADVSCNNMHHIPKHRHGYDETCPAVVEYGEAINSAIAAFARAKQ